MTFVSQAFSPWCKADVRVYTASTETIDANIKLSNALDKYMWAKCPLDDSEMTASFRLKMSVRNANTIISKLIPAQTRSYHDIFG